jgi:hypothetical protein
VWEFIGIVSGIDFLPTKNHDDANVGREAGVCNRDRGIAVTSRMCFGRADFHAGDSGDFRDESFPSPSIENSSGQTRRSGRLPEFFEQVYSARFRYEEIGKYSKRKLIAGD